MKSQKQNRLAVFGTLILTLLSGCTGSPDGVTVVTDFEIDRYLGTWYEIARLDHSFERGLSSVSANYSLRDFVGASNVGQLKVSFFGPFYGGYNIIELDKSDYQYSLVAGPDRDYLWILSRTPHMQPDILQSLVDKARKLGFATDALIFVKHD
jgi:apolipoprotein D and lipocalin family protein